MVIEIDSPPTTLGDRMKWYEREWRHELPRGAWCVLRVDVRAAHTLLRHARKPFDPTFTEAMTAVAEALCAEVQGAILAYTQSDECSIIYRAPNEKSEPWFGGVLAKQLSISAGLASAVLTEEYQRAVFDSRAFILPFDAEVENYLIWRQRDAMRNAVSMVAQSVFSHRQLHRKNTDDMVAMLAAEGVNYSDIPAGDRLGRQTVKETGERDVTYTDRRSGEEVSTVALRSWWDTDAAPLYQVGNTPITQTTEETPRPAEVKKAAKRLRAKTGLRKKSLPANVDLSELKSATKMVRDDEQRRINAQVRRLTRHPKDRR